MKAYRIIFFALLLVLGACSQAPTPEATPEEETLTSQGVLSGASGLVYYVVHNPNAAKPYSVVRYDQATNTKTNLYRGNREIQSVAGTLSGSSVFISMRETTNSSSDFEIFRITGLSTVSQATANSTDDTNISVTRGQSFFPFGYTMTWETQVLCGLACTKRGIQVRSVSIGSSDSFVLAGAGDLTQPSISGNGSYLAFVRRSGNTKSVERYTVSTKTFSVIASNSVPLGSTYSAPSPSDNGNKVVYLSSGLLGQSIKLYNSGATSTIVSGATFSHPNLTADGNWLTYAQQVNSTYRIKTRSLITNLETDSTAPASPVSHFAPFWQKAP